MEISIEKALKIDGWMSTEELRWLGERATEHKQIVEIGSYLGRSTRALADNTNGLVVALDDWNGPRDVSLEKKERLELYKRFSENVKDLVDRQIVIPIISDHKKLPAIVLNMKPDMVFVDGGHEYEDIVSDVKIWKPRIREGGLLCGHDASLFEVIKALEDCKIDAVTIEGTDIWATYV